MSSFDFRRDVDLACRAAEEFVPLYYDTYDKRRRQLIKLYADTATMVWNGNAVSGRDALVEFFEMLPSSQFQINMFDSQPVHEQATQGQKTVMVVVHGSVKYEGNKLHNFNQNFLLTIHTTPSSQVWKIISDCFRFHDWAS
ncbi:NTF2-related export protein 2 [Spea bombifrons]|uniref:NTF2-related export protein 2 n=1 Tax=Spea bombifrons TaxID=233779 RepID=UPI00234BE3BE|nr:NTF2-related export protein 2 [Spea bombifrons]